MKVDLYTKIVLSITAVCLLIIVAKDISFISEVYAKTDRGENVIKVQIVSIDESPSLRWEAIPVIIEK